MAGSRLPSAALSLKQFLQRQRVLGIYRNMLRTIRQVPAETDRKYLRDWAREEFKRNKDATDQVHTSSSSTQTAHLDQVSHRTEQQSCHLDVQGCRPDDDHTS
ncbi:hypothetical protein PAMP_013821 [Pampus punctatissimus]